MAPKSAQVGVILGFKTLLDASKSEEKPTPKTTPKNIKKRLKKFVLAWKREARQRWELIDML